MNSIWTHSISICKNKNKYPNYQISIIFLSARVAAFAIHKSRKNQWYKEYSLIDPAINIGAIYLMIGVSIVSGKFIVVRKDTLRKYACINSPY
jgi:hypothetical protein